MDIRDNRPLKCSECGSTENHIQVLRGANLDYSLAICDDCGHERTIEVHKRQEEFSDKTYKDETYRMF